MSFDLAGTVFIFRVNGVGAAKLVLQGNETRQAASKRARVIDCSTAISSETRLGTTGWVTSTAEYIKKGAKLLRRCG